MSRLSDDGQKISTPNIDLSFASLCESSHTELVMRNTTGKESRAERNNYKINWESVCCAEFTNEPNTKIKPKCLSNSLIPEVACTCISKELINTTLT